MRLQKLMTPPDGGSGRPFLPTGSPTRQKTIPPPTISLCTALRRSLLVRGPRLGARAQTATDLFCLDILFLGQIENRQPGPIATGNRAPTNTALQLVPDRPRSGKIWVGQLQKVGTPDLCKVVQNRSV